MIVSRTSNEQGGYLLVEREQNDGIGWRLTYGVGQGASGKAAEVEGGGFVVAGTIIAPSMQNDLFVLRLDSVGSPLWERRFGGPNMDSLQKCRETRDGGYVLAALIVTDVGTQTQVIRLSATGEVLWTQNIDPGYRDEPLDIQELTNGDFVFTGFTSSRDPSTTGDFATTLVRLSPTGEIRWYREFMTGRHNTSFGAVVHEAHNGDLLVAGGAVNVEAETAGQDGFLMRTDAQGRQRWIRYYGAQADDSLRGIAETSSGDVVLCGRHDEALWILKVSSEGILLWEKLYFTGSSWGYAEAVSLPESGGILIFGRARGQWGTTSPIWIQTDSNGSVSSSVSRELEETAWKL